MTYEEFRQEAREEQDSDPGPASRQRAVVGEALLENVLGEIRESSVGYDDVNTRVDLASMVVHAADIESGEAPSDFFKKLEGTTHPEVMKAVAKEFGTPEGIATLDQQPPQEAQEAILDFIRQEERRRIEKGLSNTGLAEVIEFPETHQSEREKIAA